MIPSEPHGKWMCTLNAQGEYVTWETGDENMNNADSWKTTGKNYCEFKIPKNARNFAITAAGGGGGGAGAEKTYFLRSGSLTIPIDEKMYGTYKMLAIASGGSGGISECDWNGPLGGTNLWNGKDLFGAGGGGGAGGVGYAEYVIGKGTKALILTQGSGVYITVDGAGASDGRKGKDSIIERVYENSNGIDTSEKIIHATGGEGGDGLWHICSNHADDGYGKGGVNGSVSFEGNGEYKNKSKITAYKSKNVCSGYSCIGLGLHPNRNCVCYSYYDEYEMDDINDFFGSAVINTDKETQPGRGGNTGSSKDRSCSESYAYCANNYWIRSDQSRITRSPDGIAVVATNKVIPGNGGGAAVGISNSLKTDFGNVLSLKVTIGKGGAGGKAGKYDTENQRLLSRATNGSAGTRTVIGNNIFVLNGGSGGKAGQDENQSAGWASIAGLDGEQAPINNSKVLVQTGLDQAKRKLYQKGWGGMAHLDQYAEGAEVGPDGNTSVFYGAGGGGGGVGEDGSLGNGGAGSPGFVMIEW